jgi:uncharacterized peroxidase-related enzyme
LAGNESLLQRLKRDPMTAGENDRERALIAYAVGLTRAPASITSADLETLRQAGLTDAAIHSAAAVTAYFNFVNRIALGLGVELEVGD